VKYFSKSHEVRIVNELQDCEEDNLHYTVVEIKDSIISSSKKLIVLPILTGDMNSTANNQLFFPSRTEERKELIVKGKFSKAGHYLVSSGCLGAHLLKVDEIISVRKLDNSYTYPIHN
jgi:WD40 repeat protein